MSEQWTPFDPDPAPQPPLAPPPAAAPPPPIYAPFETDGQAHVASRRELREAQAAQAEAVKEERQVKRRRPITAAVVTVLVVVIGAVGFIAGKPLYDRLTQPKETTITDYPGPGQGETSITIEQGDPGAVIGQKLVEADVIATVGAFITAWDKAGERASSIQPGTYALFKQMSAEGALTALLDPANRNAIVFTVPEGKRAAEVYQIIGSAIAKADLGADADPAVLEQKAAEDAQVVQQAAGDTAAIGLPPEANGLVEGWLFPETYSFNIGTEPSEILAKMVSQTIAVLESLKVPRERWLEVLTIGSLIEKEGKLPEDRAKVSRVIQNRLAAGTRLQFDSTVAYGVGRFDQSVATTDAERNDDNPYNTYRVPALPSGPICNPGKATINAALDPAPGAWVFFCTWNLDTGETLFSVTEEEHQKCVEKWRAWEREQAG